MSSLIIHFLEQQEERDHLARKMYEIAARKYSRQHFINVVRHSIEELID
jgi:hypothetical protein